MKKIYLPLLVAVAVFTACTQTVTETAEKNLQNENTSSLQTEPVQQIENQFTPNEGVKTFDITVRQWEYEPNIIEVDEGDTVVIRATSEDVPHSFTLPDFSPQDDPGAGFNVLLNPGKTETTTFVADKKGEFMFGCDVVCGSGHTTMTGVVIARD